MESWARILLLALAVAVILNVSRGSFRTWFSTKFLGSAG